MRQASRHDITSKKYFLINNYVITMAPSAQSIAKVCLFGRLAKKFKVKVCLRYKIKVKKLIKLLKISVY